MYEQIKSNQNMNTHEMNYNHQQNSQFNGGGASDFSHVSPEIQQILQNQILVKCDFESFNKHQQKLTLNRVGSLKTQTFLSGLWNGYLVDVVHFSVPGSKYLFKKQKTQKIVINLTDGLDNQKFALQTMGVDIYNSALANLKIKSATMKVSPVLSGLRYYMHHWFFTSAFIFIIGLTLAISVTIMVLLLILKIVFKVRLRY